MERNPSMNSFTNPPDLNEIQRQTRVAGEQRKSYEEQRAALAAPMNAAAQLRAPHDAMMWPGSAYPPPGHGVAASEQRSGLVPLLSREEVVVVLRAEKVRAGYPCPATDEQCRVANAKMAMLDTLIDIFTRME